MDPDRDIVQLTQQYLEYLNDVLRDIKAFGEHVYILADEHLVALNVQKAEPLDIDETTIDFGARFYSPRVSVELARQTTDNVLVDHQDHVSRGDWRKRCRRGSFPLIFEDEETWGPEERHPLCTPEQCATFRLHWCLAAGGASNYNHSYFESCDFGVWEDSGWYYVCDERLALRLPGHNPRGRIGTPPRPYSFYVNTALFWKNADSDKPHIGGTVVDSMEPGQTDVLRSEVAAAVGLLQQQVRRGDFRRHHTLPAIVFSFHHDRSGRITQFHFDSRSMSLTMRQSRLLDFRSDEPTTDAYHMIRWMANRPIGDTKHGAATAEEEELGFWDGSGTNNG